MENDKIVIEEYTLPKENDQVEMMMNPFGIGCPTGNGAICNGYGAACGGGCAGLICGSNC